MWNGTNTVFWEERANPFTWIKWTTPSTASWNSFMLCFTHELFVWRRLKWVSVHIARSSAYMVSTTFPFTAVTDSGASFSIRYETVSTPVETLTFLMEAKARLSSVQVSGVLTARLSSGTGCVKVASISRRNCCLSAGRLGVTGLGESFRESVRFALGRRVLCAAVLQVRIRNNALLLYSSDLLPHRS